MFRTFFKAAAFASASALFFSPAALADDPLSVLIIGDDGDIETLPRNSEIFAHMLQGITEVVEARGFAAYGESATEAAGSIGDRASRRPAELVEMAQTVAEGSVDVVTAFRIYARAVADPGSGDISIVMNVSGRIFQVPGGKWIGQYQVDVAPGDLPTAPEDCDTDCISAFLNAQAETVGADVGAQVATRLELIASDQ